MLMYSVEGTHCDARINQCIRAEAINGIPLKADFSEVQEGSTSFGSRPVSVACVNEQRNRFAAVAKVAEGKAGLSGVINNIAPSEQVVSVRITGNGSVSEKHAAYVKSLHGTYDYVKACSAIESGESPALVPYAEICSSAMDGFGLAAKIVRIGCGGEWGEFVVYTEDVDFFLDLFSTERISFFSFGKSEKSSREEVIT